MTPKKSESPVVVDDLKDLKSFKDNNTNTDEPTPKKSESHFLTLLTLGKVWQSSRASLAQRLADGSIPLTLLDVAGIICWAQVQAESIGAFVRFHVEQGTQPPEEHVPPTDDIHRIITWVRATPRERTALEETWNPMPPLPAGEGRGEGDLPALQSSPSVDMSADIFTQLAARVPALHRQHWFALKAELQLQLTKSTFDTWLRDVELIHVLPLSAGEGRGEGDLLTFTLLVENAYAKDWLEAKMISTLQRTAHGIVGRDVSFELLTLDEAASKYQKESNQ